MSKKSRRIRKKKVKLLSLGLVLIVGIFAAAYAVNGFSGNEQNPVNNLTEKPSEKDETTNVSKTPEPVVESTVSINIKAIGDIMFHPSQIDGAYNSATNSYDFHNSFKAVKDTLKSADLTIANFEGTTAGNDIYEYQGYPLFNAPDEVLDAIKDSGIDVLSTVNNHCLDTRKAGVIRTVQEISKRGMEPIGTYVEKPETRVLIKDVNGIKIAILAYTEMVNGLESTLSPEDLDVMVNIIDEEKISEDIAYAKSKDADIIIACMHWGDEYERVQAPRQEALADRLFTQGVDIVLGSHPHVIQQAQILEYDGKTKFVAYSMGNFLSNQRIETLESFGMMEAESKYTEDGVIIDINIEKDNNTGETSIKNVSYIPLWVYKGKTEDGVTEHVVYPIMEYIESNELNEKSKMRMQRSLSDTAKQMQSLSMGTAE